MTRPTVFVLKLLRHLLEPSKIPLTIAEQVETPLKVVERIEAEAPDLVLISHLPPDGLTAARYLVRRIKARHPQLPVVVGRWDESQGRRIRRRASQGRRRLGDAWQPGRGPRIHRRPDQAQDPAGR